MFVGEDRPGGRARSTPVAGSRGKQMGYGRFMQADPLGYGDGMNWYNYVGSDPVNKIDPTGLAIRCVTSAYYTYTNTFFPGTSYSEYRTECFDDGSGYEHGYDARNYGGAGGGGGSQAPTQQSQAPQRNPICPRNGLTDVLGKLRALPATAAGLLAGYVAGVAQEFSGGGAVHIGIGNNAIQFTGLTGGDPVGLTLGNVQLYGAGTGPNGRRGRYDGGVAIGNMGSHEEGHTYQFQSYSLAYMGYQFAASKFGDSKTNTMENEADNYADRGPNCS